MKKFIYLMISIFMAFTFLCITTGKEVNASSPFKTQTLNRYGELVDTQDAYEPVKSVKVIDIDGKNETINNAQDLFIDSYDLLYLVDTNNLRVLILDSNFKCLKSFGSDRLLKPLGVFVRDDLIYISDYGLENDLNSGQILIYKYDRLNNEVTYLKTFKKPTSDLLEIDNFIFRPEKIAVDKNLTMYIVCKGSSNGLLLVNSNNRFLNYFAPNTTSGNFFDSLKDYLYGNNNKVILKKKIPTPPSNVMLDDSGYIYTVTSTGVTKNNLGDAVKKVNIGGVNFYPGNMRVSSNFVDSFSSDYKTVYALSGDGFIYEYDTEGTLLFRFGGSIATDEQLGLFKSASSIAVDSKGNLYIVDPNSNAIQVFRKTLFTSKVHEALSLYISGKYVESKGLWEEVLRYNSMFDLAHKGIGLAYYLEGDYDKALDKFEIAYDKENYSEAFWEVRNVFIMNNLTTMLIVTLVIILLIVSVKGFNKKYHFLSPVGDFTHKIIKNKYVSDAFYFRKFIRHPLDAIYDLRIDKSIKAYNGFIMLLLIFILYLINISCTGFLFNNIVLEKTILIKEAIKVILPILIFVLANYLVSSLMSGEGTLRLIFMNTVFSLVPILLMLPFIILISNVLTYNEGFIYYFLMAVMIIWTVVLEIVSLRETHDYTFKQTVVNLILTFLMMFIIVVVFMLVYLIIFQVGSFILDIFKEALFK